MRTMMVVHDVNKLINCAHILWIGEMYDERKCGIYIKRSSNHENVKSSINELGFDEFSLLGITYVDDGVSKISIETNRDSYINVVKKYRKIYLYNGYEYTQNNIAYKVAGDDLREVLYHAINIRNKIDYIFINSIASSRKNLIDYVISNSSFNIVSYISIYLKDLHE